MRARALIVLGLVATAIAAFACASSDSPDAGASCPDDLPAACPTPPPSYSAEVQGIFVRDCFGCHTDGGVAVGIRDFSTYDGIAAARTTVLSQVYSCKMPPSDAGQPTTQDREKLLAWLVCKAPNN